jgi:hypothetical protein
VEWKTEIVDGQYKKMTNPTTGKIYPEHNWVWSPQGVINMRQPETWGFIQFSEMSPGSKHAPFVLNEDEKVKWELMKVYHAQSAYKKSTGKWAKELIELKNVGLDTSSMKYFRSIQTTKSLYEATAQREKSDFIWHLDQGRKLWKTEKK